MGQKMRVGTVTNHTSPLADNHRLEERETGGRAVLHDQEFTYSVIVAENHPPYAGGRWKLRLSTSIAHFFR
jgi:lipoyl(octanoyl) transferase